MTEKIIEVGGKGNSDIAGQAHKVIDRRQAEIEKMYRPHRLDFTPINYGSSVIFVAKKRAFLPTNITEEP